jgi:hypothetical protein
MIVTATPLLETPRLKYHPPLANITAVIRTAIALLIGFFSCSGASDQL